MPRKREQPKKRGPKVKPQVVKNPRAVEINSKAYSRIRCAAEKLMKNLIGEIVPEYLDILLHNCFFFYSQCHSNRDTAFPSGAMVKNRITKKNGNRFNRQFWGQGWVALLVLGEHGARVVKQTTKAIPKKLNAKKCRCAGYRLTERHTQQLGSEAIIVFVEGAFIDHLRKILKGAAWVIFSDGLTPLQRKLRILRLIARDRLRWSTPNQRTHCSAIPMLI